MMPQAALADAPVPPHVGGRLNTVELGRGLAALAVVLFHANAAAREFHGPQPAWPSFGEHGVDFFFVLSGFIIFAAHRDDLGVPGKGRDYLLKRAIRLLPLLWCVVLGWAALRTMAGAMPDAATVLRSLFLWPSLKPALPQVVWTLRHEAIFYAAFLVLLVRPAWGRMLFGGWMMAAITQALAVLAGRPVGGVASLFLSTFTLDFLLGAMVATFYRCRPPSGSCMPLVVGLAALVIAAVTEHQFGLKRVGTSDYVSLVATYWTLALGMIFALILWGLLMIERRVRVPQWGVALGGASYAIYLVHTPLNSLTQRVVAHLPRGLILLGGGHLLVIGVGVGGGFAAHYLFERPVSRLLRQRLLPRRSATAAPGLSPPA